MGGAINRSFIASLLVRLRNNHSSKVSNSISKEASLARFLR